MWILCFNYKIYTILAKDEKELVKKIMTCWSRFSRIVRIYYQPDGGDCDAVKIESAKHMNSYVGAPGDFFSHNNLSVFDKFEQPFSYEEFVKFYEGREMQFLEELQTSEGGESACVLYLGNAEQARKTLRANNPESARKYRYDSDEPIGEMIFQGKRIYADLGCTHSGILHI